MKSPTRCAPTTTSSSETDSRRRQARGARKPAFRCRAVRAASSSGTSGWISGCGRKRCPRSRKAIQKAQYRERRWVFGADAMNVTSGTDQAGRVRRLIVAADRESRRWCSAILLHAPVPGAVPQAGLRTRPWRWRSRSGHSGGQNSEFAPTSNHTRPLVSRCSLIALQRSLEAKDERAGDDDSDKHTLLFAQINQPIPLHASQGFRWVATLLNG
jgi:hypothetical protein